MAMSQSRQVFFGASGLRGKVPEGLRLQLIFRYIHAFCDYVNPRELVIGRDPRPSGRMIVDYISSIIRWRGCQVVDLGVVPTPTLAIAVDYLGADGGLMVTASHNPEPWNGLKFFKRGGLSFFEEDLIEFQQCLDKESSSQNFSVYGRLQKVDCAFQWHYQRLEQALDFSVVRERGLTVVIDSGNGSGSPFAPYFLKKIGCHVIEFNCDIHKSFSRDPEPHESHVGATQEFVRNHQCDICFVQDADADRLSIILPDGRYVKEENTLSLALMSLSSLNGKVITNDSSSRLIDEIASQQGCQVIRSKVGESHVVKAIFEEEAFLGGEGSGGVIFPRVHCVRDSFSAMALILNLLATQSQSCEEILQSLPVFYMSKEKYDLSVKREKEIIQILQKECAEAHLVSLDGYKWEWGQDAWLSVRRSKTEPVCRVIFESKNKDFFDQMMVKLKRLFLLS